MALFTMQDGLFTLEIESPTPLIYTNGQGPQLTALIRSLAIMNKMDPLDSVVSKHQAADPPDVWTTTIKTKDGRVQKQEVRLSDGWRTVRTTDYWSPESIPVRANVGTAVTRLILEGATRIAVTFV